MKISKITYYSVPRNDSAVCDCCGKSIQNICAVTTKDQTHLLFGTTCFDKLIKDKLTSWQRKEMNRLTKSIKFYNQRILSWQDMTEEKFRSGWKGGEKMPWDEYDDIHSFEEYKAWMLNEFYPYRLSLEEKELEKFSKIEF